MALGVAELYSTLAMRRVLEQRLTQFSQSALMLIVSGWFLVACSESFITTPEVGGDMVVPGSEGLGSSSGQGGAPAAEPWSEYEIAVETGVDNDSVLAGEPVKVF